MTMHGTEKETHGNPTQETGSDGTPSSEQGTPEINEAQQYSGAEVRKLLSADGRKQKDRADKAETEVKRLTGQVDGFTTQVNTLTAQMAEITKAQNEAEVAKVSDDPVAISSLRARQANVAEALRLTGVDTAYKAREGKLTERETEVANKETSINIKLAAMEAEVDEAELADLVPDGNPGRLKKAADILKKRGPAGDQPRGGKPLGLGQRPASAISAGGGLGDLSADDKITRGLAQKKK